MFGSQVLDIALGLFTLYLTLALAVTAANELFSQWRRLRARHLELALVQMLDGASGKAGKDHWFLHQPLVRSLGDPDGHLPSYLDKHSFSAALLLAIDEDFATRPPQDLLARIDALPVATGARQLLRNFLQLSQGEVTAFRSQIEAWFDQTMERASGRYKRHIARWSLVIASVLVVLGNADTLAIVHALHGNGAAQQAALQDQAVNAARASLLAALEASKDPASIMAASGEAMGQLMSIGPGLPLGWDGTRLPTGWGWLDKVLGLVLTILATSVGAPFWFDMLSRVSTIRAAGKRPA